VEPVHDDRPPVPLWADGKLDDATREQAGAVLWFESLCVAELVAQPQPVSARSCWTWPLLTIP
jgi:hypothetical protein